ncbi:MAG: response regulator [bacterium]
MKDEELIQKLRAAFKLEAEERLANLSSGILKLEKRGEPAEQHAIIEVIFREAHSLKGAARAVNLTDIESIFQSIESVFSALKKEKIPLSPQLFDTLHSSLEAVEKFITASFEGQAPLRHEDILSIIRQLEDLAYGKKHYVKPLKGKTNENSTKENSPKEKNKETKNPLETIRLPQSKLDSVLLKVEEMVSMKLLLSQQVSNLENLSQLFSIWRKADADIKSECKGLIEKMGQNTAQVTRLIEFVRWNHDHIQSLGNEIKTFTKAAKQDHRLFSRMVDDLLDDIKRITMLPFSTLCAIFPKIVRDISRQQEKEVELSIQGDNIEIDRRILEEIKDPLIHLLRNALDHGIENPKERVKKKKPEYGTITMTIAQNEGNRIEILFSDDGRGMDSEQIKSKAVKLGIISKKDAAKIQEQEALHLVFHSELSTSSMINEISGRGLGLAIVHEKIEKLGGIVSLENARDRGCTFRIQLPVTLATFRGVLVKAADNLFITPASHVERVVRIEKEQIKTLKNKPTVSLHNTIVSLVSLADVLHLPQNEEKRGNAKYLTAMVLEAGEKRIAFVVDAVLSEHEILIKSLGTQLHRVPNIAGATILGSGMVVPILNVQDLFNSSRDTFAWPPPIEVSHSGKHDEKKYEEKKSVLIVEDSITSRMLLKNILEGAGYYVQTAVDGRDAYTILKNQTFDAIVSDIEMPRMNGFELTKKIRTESKFPDIPVVLVTSLETREDREKGIDAGANAYIVKKSFDHDRLLKVIERLL